MIDRIIEYLTVEVWTLMVAGATLIVSILSYRFARKSAKENQNQIALIQKQQKDFFDSYNDRIKAEEEQKNRNAELMAKSIKEESKRINSMFNSYHL